MSLAWRIMPLMQRKEGMKRQITSRYTKPAHILANKGETSSSFENKKEL
jgi:hypothetical protein